LRYFLKIAYNGARYHGWQVQHNAHSVQAELNEKLSLQLGEDIYCVGCGRTDTGVHAREYYAHFDSSKQLTANHVRKLDIFLPIDISASALYEVPDEASSRWDAVAREYTYIISLRKNPLLLGYAAYLHEKLDVEAMNEACRVMAQFRDLEALSKVNVQNKHHLSDIAYARWRRFGDILMFKIEANRFLRGQVRVTVGTMLEIGKGKMSIDSFRQMLETKDRSKAGTAAPPEGLYLSKVKYREGLLDRPIL
jgi:tRNA pseudouridine38-40 synthase